jgi:hypothetical protein
VRLALLLLVPACRVGFDPAVIEARGETWSEDDSADHRNVTTDTYVSGETFPDERDTNFGADDSLRLGEGRIGLVRFDLSAVAPATQIASASLRFDSPDNHGEIDLFLVREAWSETTATWNKRDATSAWMSPGIGVGSRSSEPAATIESGSGQRFVSLPPELVEAWIAAPGTNFGFAIKPRSTSNLHEDEGTRFVAREGANGMRPSLALEFAN